MQILLNLKYAIFKRLCREGGNLIGTGIVFGGEHFKKDQRALFFKFTYSVEVYHIYAIKYNLHKQNYSNKTLLSVLS